MQLLQPEAVSSTEKKLWSICRKSEQLYILRWHIRSWKSVWKISKAGVVVLRDGQTLYDLYLERTPLYEKYADIRISETGLDIEQTVEQIVDGITNLH